MLSVLIDDVEHEDLLRPLTPAGHSSIWAGKAPFGTFDVKVGLYENPG